MCRFLTTMSYMCMDLNLLKSLGREMRCTVDLLWNCSRSGSDSFLSRTAYDVITSLVGACTSTFLALLPIDDDSLPGFSTSRTTPFLNTHTPDILLTLYLLFLYFFLFFSKFE
ncbi:hypothetical protein LINGRAHAP2_LOCUS6336 [Linum grandiflorum]